MQNKAQKVVIVGGGTAGWMCGALLARTLGNVVDITLVESDAIGIVGVGEATVPPIKTLYKVLGLDERDFMRRTHATMKLGIQFEGWGQLGDSYMHTFNNVGKDYPNCEFHHLWFRAREKGLSDDLWDYSLSYQAAKRNKFALFKGQGDLPAPGYAYHFDASLLAAYLREYSEARGVKRVEGLIDGFEQCSETGNIDSIHLKNGQSISGDLFLDCSGFRGLLIEEALHTGYEDWTHWLPCDRAVAVPSASFDHTAPYTRAIAHEAGWQWQIPLQHRNGNGLVFSSQYYSEDEVKALLLSNLGSEPQAEPRVLRFTTGRRRKQWNKNVVSIGLASGFLEPLESTSIHLIQSGIFRLLKYFPHHGLKQIEIDEYNRLSKLEFEQVRDLIIAHYHVTQRNDSEFWRYCANMSIPDSLRDKLELFGETGILNHEENNLFGNASWLQVLVGQNLIPRDYHIAAATFSNDQLAKLLAGISNTVEKTLPKMPDHKQFLEKYCSIDVPSQALSQPG